jgi:hypothetical protein
MTDSIIRAAFEKRLADMVPDLSTAYENKTFTPVAGTPYQRVNLLPGDPDNSPHAIYFEQGIFQITLCYPLNTGPGAAEARVGAIKTWFALGTTMLESGVTTRVTSTPRRGPAYDEGDRYCIPVSVSYQAQIN